MKLIRRLILNNLGGEGKYMGTLSVDEMRFANLRHQKGSSFLDRDHCEVQQGRSFLPLHTIFCSPISSEQTVAHYFLQG